MDGFEDAYTLSAIALFLTSLLVAWLISSPLGVLWRALAVDERRLAFLGFDYNHLKAVAFGISGFLGGIAGVLYAPENNLVTPDLFSFALSTNFVVWVAIGGRTTLYGPILGSVLIGLLTATLRETISYWEVILAGLFIFVVLYFRHGVIGLIEPRLREMLQRRNAKRIEAPAKFQTKGDGLMELSDIQLSVGSVNILNNLSLNLVKPCIYCLIGPNGAGKTTVFNAVTGELASQSGSMIVMGAEQSKPDASELTRTGLGRKFQIPSIFDELTIGENIAIALWSGRVRKCDLLSFTTMTWKTPVLEALENQFEFLRDSNRIAGDLSHGERQILDIAMVLCTEPKLILLDEPCGGLSPVETRQVIDTIRWANATFGATALIIEHDMTLVRELADHVFVLHNGELLAEGAVEVVQQNAAVKAVYAGGTK